MEQAQFISDLILMNARHRAEVKHVSSLSKEALMKHPENVGWNVLECIDHLRAYGDFYIQEFDRVISKAKPRSAKPFRPGMMGGRSAKSMLPDQKGFPLNPMKTFKKMNMAGKVNEPAVLHTFIAQCDQLEALLKKAQSADLNTNRCRLTLPLITFNLGDTLAFHIYHNERHIQQAKRAIR
jgi:hypothetical protein